MRALLLTVCLASLLAHAGERGQEATPAAPDVVLVPWNFRLGLGAMAGFSLYDTRALARRLTLTDWRGGGGPWVRMGVNLTDRLSFEGEIAIATLLALGFVRLSTTLNYSPTRWLTLGAGPAGNWLFTFNLFEGARGLTSLGGVARIDLNLGAREHSVWHGFVVSLVANMGAAVSLQGVTHEAGLSLLLGYARF